MFKYEYDVFGVAYASVNNVEAVTDAQNKKTLNIKKSNGSETANDGNTDELVIDNIRYKRYNSIGKIGNTRLYTGREYDAELKLYYNRTRYYSPDLGRFISRDPIDISDDVNLYGYVGNNSVMFVDRMGLSKDSIIDRIIDINHFLGAYIPLEISRIGGDVVQLDIASYMLDKFLYGDNSNEYYNNTHFISEKLMKTDFYLKQKNYLINEVKKNQLLIEGGETLYLPVGHGTITDSNKLLEFDFGNSFGTINWQLSANINDSGEVIMNLNIKDTYNFHYLDGTGDVITNPFNVWAKYLEEEGYGNPFSWELNISETINY